MMSPNETNLQRTTSSVTVPGGRLTVSVLGFPFKPLLKAQWQAGYEIGYAEAQACNQVRKQRIIMEKHADGDVAACLRYAELAVTSALASGTSSQRKRYFR